MSISSVLESHISAGIGGSAFLSISVKRNSMSMVLLKIDDMHKLTYQQQVRPRATVMI